MVSCVPVLTTILAVLNPPGPPAMLLTFSAPPAAPHANTSTSLVGGSGGTVARCVGSDDPTRLTAQTATLISLLGSTVTSHLVVSFPFTSITIASNGVLLIKSTPLSAAEDGDGEEVEAAGFEGETITL
ncbi:hypothetical protein Pelo_3362 [Pelomyxa schiedti]|nr:hypothetical protein Pelo_3362 [Pelomyxa schiedti]